MSGTHCEIYIKEQILAIFKSNKLYKEYPISSAKNGIGNLEGSFKTPLGKHSIIEKIGDGEKIYTIFKGRKPLSENFSLENTSPDDDFILTRILRLQGEELGINKGISEGKCIDSYQRYIYIHGTHDEKNIGTPVSHGCIRMKNQDILEAFEILNIYDTVTIFTNKLNRNIIEKPTDSGRREQRK